MAAIQNVIFDMGMVLVNFRWREYMAELGMDENVVEELGERMVMSEFWKDLDRGARDEDDAPDYFKSVMPQYAKEIDLFWANITDIVCEFDYAAPLIRSLHEAGYRVYLLSNYPAKLAKLHWPTFSFIHDVDGMVISAEEHKVKPDPGIYEVLLDRYHLVPEECIFLDDLEKNIEAARKIGMKGIVFQSYGQALEELEQAGVRNRGVNRIKNQQSGYTSGTD
jgi:putative hydrolase of the HAD superfamily